MTKRLGDVAGSVQRLQLPTSEHTSTAGDSRSAADRSGHSGGVVQDPSDRDVNTYTNRDKASAGCLVSHGASLGKGDAHNLVDKHTDATS